MESCRKKDALQTIKHKTSSILFVLMEPQSNVENFFLSTFHFRGLLGLCNESVNVSHLIQFNGFCIKTYFIINSSEAL